MIFVFDRFRLDLERRELREGSRIIPLQPQVFDLLVHLVSNRHRVVSKDDLLRDVWGGRIVSESALATRIHAARRAVGDDGATQHLIRTVSRSGYRFVGQVRERRATPPAKPSPVRQDVATSQAAPGLANAPSIAVLPFANFTSQRDLDYFAGSLTEELTIALSRIHWLIVVAGTTVSGTAIARTDDHWSAIATDARYALTGTVSEVDQRLRVTLHLIETATSAHLWADHYDGALDNRYELQDRVASRAAGLVEPLLETVEGARLVDEPTDDLTAREGYLRAVAMLASARRLPAALALLEDTIARQPEDGPVLALAANCSMRRAMDQVGDDPAADSRKGAEYAWRALEVAPEDPNVLANVARPLAYAGEDIGATISMMDRALALNPNFARGWYIRGFLRYWAGDSETAIAEVETAQRLSPRSRFGTPFTVIGNALLFCERFDEAVAATKLAIQQDPSFPPNYRILAIAYAHLGCLDKARAALRRLPARAPMVIEKTERSYRAMLRNTEQCELALWGVRKAAW